MSNIWDLFVPVFLLEYFIYTYFHIYTLYNSDLEKVIFRIKKVRYVHRKIRKKEFET